MLPFDPIELRDFWLKVRLKYALDSAPRGPGPNRPAGVAHMSRTNYSVGRVGDFVGGYLVGLWRELKPTVEKHTAWMESEPEPDRVVYIESGCTYEGWLESYMTGVRHLGCASGSVEGTTPLPNLRPPPSQIGRSWSLRALRWHLRRAPVVASSWAIISQGRSRPMRR